MSQRIQSEATTLDGLFSARDKDSSLIQSKVNVPNFFNPNRLVDQVLFKEKLHVYMNVAIYRDVSGSTTGNTHTLMHQVCEQLYKDIPVNITYYLYASGREYCRSTICPNGKLVTRHLKNIKTIN